MIFYGFSCSTVEKFSIILISCFFVQISKIEFLSSKLTIFNDFCSEVLIIESIDGIILKANNWLDQFEACETGFKKN